MSTTRDVYAGVYKGDARALCGGVDVPLAGRRALIHVNVDDETQLTAQFDEELHFDRGDSVVRLDMYWHPFATADFDIEAPEEWDEV